MRKPAIIIVIILSVFITVSDLKAGAPPPPPTGGSTPPCWPPPCIPIDGGITLLAVAGAAFAGKKLYENRKKQSGETEL